MKFRKLNAYIVVANQIEKHGARINQNFSERKKQSNFNVDFVNRNQQNPLFVFHHSLTLKNYVI